MDILVNSLAQGGPVFALLTLVLFWVFTKYIPEMQKTFKESLQLVVDSIGSRLDRIEEDISKFK